MSEANVEIVRSVYAHPRGLSSAESDKFASDVEFDFTLVYFDRPIMRGVEALRRFRDSGPWSGAPIHFEPERFFDAGDRVLVFVRASATGKGSGAQVELRVAHEFAIRDGRVVRFKVYPDREQALEAVGLGE